VFSNINKGHALKKAKYFFRFALNVNFQFDENINFKRNERNILPFLKHALYLYY
jgi:hypothetical protein